MVPLVSVVVVTYQHAKYIRQCLDSILAQKCSFPFEIILGEDESTDGTREICSDYANRYPEVIRLFLRSRKDVIYIDGKPSGRFNLLESLKASKGKYIALCEGDDYWDNPSKLEKQVAFMEAHPDYSVCFHRVHELFNDKDKHLSYLNTSLKEETYTINDLAKGNLIHTPSVLYRNVFNGQYPKLLDHSAVADYVLHMFHAKHGLIRYLPEPMAVYRRHAGGLWSGYAREQKVRVRIRWMNMIEELIPEFGPEVSRILKTQYSISAFLLGKEYEKENDPINASAHYKMAVKYESDLFSELELKQEPAAPAEKKGIRSLVRRSIKRIIG